MGLFKSAAFGVILFPVSIGLLWWNEGRAVDTSRGLEQGAEIVLEADANQVDPRLAGKLIHLTGQVITEETLKDPQFGLETNALKFKRNVEMYQWIEKSKGNRSTNTETKNPDNYTYETAWRDEVVSSNDFAVIEGHENPGTFPFPPFTEQVEGATIGSFQVTKYLIRKIKNYQPFDISRFDTTKVFSSRITFENNTELEKANELIQQVYIGEGSPEQPQVGDVKVSFEYVPSGGDYSIIAQQVASTFEEFNTKTGTTIELISPGITSAANMFAEAQRQNTFMTWGLRFFGFMVMFFGWTMLFKPITATTSFIPFLGSMVSMGVTAFSGIISFAFSAVVIGISWILHRPILGISLLVIAVGVFIFFYNKSKTQQPQ